MARVATERGEASRERILDCALRLFAEKGFAATSVAEICEAAGVARTGLYWHFESKAGLLAAVLERSAREQTEYIRNAVSQAGDPGARLEAFIGHLRRVLTEQEDRLRLHLGVALERGAKDPATRHTLRNVGRTVRECLERGLEDAVGLRIPDGDLIAHTLLSLLDGAAIAMLVDPEGTDVDRLLESLRTTYVLLIGHHLRTGGPDGAGAS